MAMQPDSPPVPVTIPLTPAVKPTPAAPGIPAAEALALATLVTPTAQGIASRVLAKTSGGNCTLFAFDAGQGLTEHTSPFDAFVMVLEGSLTLSIGGTPVHATPGTIVRMPADVPHGLEAPEPARMLLLMLRERKDS
jgi:quercetin dioxygenase-like cupin family protein